MCSVGPSEYPNPSPCASLPDPGGRRRASKVPRCRIDTDGDDDGDDEGLMVVMVITLSLSRRALRAVRKCACCRPDRREQGCTVSSTPRQRTPQHIAARSTHSKPESCFSSSARLGACRSVRHDCAWCRALRALPSPSIAGHHHRHAGLAAVPTLHGLDARSRLVAVFNGFDSPETSPPTPPVLQEQYWQEQYWQE